MDDKLYTELLAEISRLSKLLPKYSRAQHAQANTKYELYQVMCHLDNIIKKLGAPV
jgi:hypothetical protein